MFASLRRRLPRLGRFPRLGLVGCCLLLALESAATGARSRATPASPTSPVVVAARALPAGHVLRRGDVRVLRWPTALRQVTARSGPGAVIGRRLTGPVAAREPLTANRVLGRNLTAGLPDGVVAAAVPVADAHVVDLVRPGDRVDLLAARRPAAEVEGPADGPVTTLARSVVSLAVFRDEDGGGAEIVLALSRSAAVVVTRDVGSHLFTVVLAPP